MLFVAPYIRTVTGRKINPLDVRVSDLDIEEMAHGLANVNRFTGNAKEPLNVAQHSVYVSRLCGDGLAGLQGLLHDGTDYILNDISKWLKQSAEFAAFRAIEDRAQAIIYSWAGLPLVMLPEVKNSDDLMVRVEGEFAWGPYWSDVPGYEPLTLAERRQVGPWDPWDWRTSRREFLARYHLLRRAVA